MRGVPGRLQARELEHFRLFYQINVSFDASYFAGDVKMDDLMADCLFNSC